MGDLISIVVPVYKVEQYLDRCVESLINQTYKNIEIILVDDGSPDNCPAMCDKYAERDRRIKVVHKENGGLSDARNAGIDAACGKYLLLVDSDDYIEKDSCEKLLSCMVSTDVDFVVGVIREIRGNTIVYQRRSLIECNCSYSNTDFIVNSIIANEWYAPAVLNLYSLSFLNKHKLRFKSGILHEDMEFLPRLYLEARKISYLDYPFYNYEIRENSITTSNNNIKKTNSLLQIYASWKRQFDEISDSKLQRVLYGVLIKHYLHSCRELGIEKWLVEGLTFRFSLKYSLNFKERIKCMIFEIMPYFYIRVGKV